MPWDDIVVQLVSCHFFHTAVQFVSLYWKGTNLARPSDWAVRFPWFWKVRPAWRDICARGHHAYSMSPKCHTVVRHYRLGSITDDCSLASPWCAIYYLLLHSLVASPLSCATLKHAGEFWDRQTDSNELQLQPRPRLKSRQLRRHQDTTVKQQLHQGSCNIPVPQKTTLATTSHKVTGDNYVSATKIKLRHK